MKPVNYQIDRFGEMVEEFATKNGLWRRHGVDPTDRNRYCIRFENERTWMEYYVYWDQVKSLTDAATSVFVDATIKFNLRDEIKQYCENDIKVTQEACNKVCNPFEPKRVIFNYPATIVFWPDDTKTVVKCHPDEEYDEMIGLAMAICKKALGNEGNYNNVFRKFVPHYGEHRHEAKPEPTHHIVLENATPVVLTGKEASCFAKQVEEMIEKYFRKGGRHND